ncbi:DUF742 domain-containing protein [Antrihabitans stalactiti]|jgi:hypothetical protein|uniref:DUF742 domain-containing protein n=1 Tax=Antrihabitans stalactiti TaxID=2584121 RepID=A0A848KD80_9NOCA|nr:DUF742 domain-containing protein [Antrihabitans stalactiti]NMN96269.1 DUF742 domain-containing protein [Antrihabitans stalactiti]
MDSHEHDVPVNRPSLVRPYSLTSGRTQPAVELALEALVQALPGARNKHWELSDVEAAILALCGESPSVAEIAARAVIPLGVARVLVADLVASGHVKVLATLRDDSTDVERRELIERVLSGLRNI